MEAVLYVLAVLAALYGVWKALEFLGRDRYTQEELDYINSYRDSKKRITCGYWVLLCISSEVSNEAQKHIRSALLLNQGVSPLTPCRAPKIGC
jgi:hypothetical protein